MNKILTAIIVLILAAVLLVSCTPADESTTEVGSPTETPAAATSDSIQGIVWNWQTWNDTTTDSSTRVPDPDNYTIIFNADGTTEGQADCNTFSGTYSQESGFTITVQTDVMAACDVGSMDQAYFRLLGDVAAGGPDGSGGLMLQTAGGAEQMLYSNGGAAP